MELTLKEVSAISGVSTIALIRRIHRGKLRAHKRGWQWFVKKSEADKLAVKK